MDRYSLSEHWTIILFAGVLAAMATIYLARHQGLLAGFKGEKE